MIGGGKMSDFKTLLAVGDLVSTKISSVSMSESVVGGAKKMADEKTSSLLVVDGADKLVGIVTEQDIVYRAVAANLDVLSPLKAIMTPNPLSIPADESIFEAKKIMLDNKVHHLIVVKDEKPLGILTSAMVMGS
jgi:CBS domain-containing protein